MKLKKVNQIGHFLLLGSIVMFFMACNKNDESDPPTIKTVEISNVQYNQVTVTGSLTSNGGEEIIERGICISLEPNPTTSAVCHKDTTHGSNDFSVDIKSLTSNRPFYVKAYAINSKGTSYGEELSFILWLNEPGEAVTDIDNNSYSTIKIGEQTWMKENLKVTHYRNGDPIAYLTLQDDEEWLNTKSGAYCAYNDILPNAQNYGYLYNGFTFYDERSICPEGWHIPTKEEIQTLVDYLGGGNTAGTLLKSDQGWDVSNFASNVLSGFTALPGGMRLHGVPERNYTEYYGIHTHTWFPTTDKHEYDGQDYMWSLMVTGQDQWADYSNSMIKTCGQSVRCIKD